MQSLQQHQVKRRNWRISAVILFFAVSGWRTKQDIVRALLHSNSLIRSTYVQEKEMYSIEMRHP